MHYFDIAGVKRLFLTALEGSTWKIWRARRGLDGPDGPFNQRFIGESRLTSRRSTADGSAAWAPPGMRGSSTSR